MQKQKNRQKPTKPEGFTDQFFDNSNLSKRNKRVREAVLYYHIEDLTQEEISEKLGVTRQTVSGYLNSEEAKQFEPYFSSREKTELKEWLEKEFWKAYKASNEAFNTIKNDENASPQTRTRAARQLIENQDRLVNWFQEVGLIQKPKERKEVEKTEDTTEHRKELADLMKQKEQEAETDEE